MQPTGNSAQPLISFRTTANQCIAHYFEHYRHVTFFESAWACRIGGKVVSVFYLRAGYSPDDYPGQAEWAGREAMESCSAISCPSVAYQLVGAKKIQQDLAAPGLSRSCADFSSAGQPIKPAEM